MMVYGYAPGITTLAALLLVGSGICVEAVIFEPVEENTRLAYLSVPAPFITEVELVLLIEQFDIMTVVPEPIEMVVEDVEANFVL